MLINFDYLIEKYQMNVNGVIHIGAHYGEEVPDYIRNGIKNIILFEPLSDNFNVLSERTRYLTGNIQLHKVALGSTKSETIMYVSDNEQQSSSILRPKVHLYHHPNVNFPTIEQIKVDVLDDYSCSDCNLICMDVQGYELEVLKGAKKTLNNIDYVYCEVNRDEVYEGNAYVEDLDQFLKQYGFERVETDWSGGIWGDAFYVKNKIDREKKMTYLSIEKLNTIVNENLEKNLYDYSTFIETGTLFGYTILTLEPYFRKIHTIEISEKYFMEFEKHKNNLGKLKINNHLGDSVELIPKLLKVLDSKDNCIFWLDGHWSSGDTGKGEKDCPLLEECVAIDSTYKSNNAIILIDDYRLFGTNVNENWTDITERSILEAFKNFTITKKFIFEDVLVLHIER